MAYSTSSSSTTLGNTSNTQMTPSKGKTSCNLAIKYPTSKRKNESTTELKKVTNLINKGTKKTKKNITTIKKVQTINKGKKVLLQIKNEIGFNVSMFDSPEDLVLKLQENHNDVCYLKSNHKIDVPSKDCYDISTQCIKFVLA